MIQNNIPTDALIDELERTIYGQLSTNVISSGYESYDKISWGFAKGEVSILASPMRYGRISMSQLFALNIMRLQPKPAIYFSADLDICKICLYYLGVYKGYNPQKEMKNHPWLRSKDLEIKLQKISQNFGFINSTGWSTSQCKSALKRIKEEKDLSCIFIDNIQFLNDAGRYENSNRNDELRMAMEGLNDIARSYNIPVIALSYLRRSGDFNLTTKAGLSDLDGGGGCLEGMAGNVTYLRYNKRLQTIFPNNTHLIDVNIEKNKHAPSNGIQLIWDNSTFRFREYHQGI